MAKDYYGVLGLPRGASVGEIKKSYRDLSKKWHPDKHKGDKEAERKFKEINEAYEVLGDPKKKQQYDQFGTAEGPGGFGQGGFDFSGFRSENPGGFGDIFETFFGGGFSGGRGARAESGQDRQVEVTITFGESFSGARKRIALNRQRSCGECGGSGNTKGTSFATCTNCGGTGQVTRTAQSFFGTVQQSFLCQTCRGRGQTPEKPCRVCGGTGRLAGRDEVQIEIPPGVSGGQTLRVAGYGDAGEHGAQSGNLYVTIAVASDPRFARDGDDIRSRATISVVDAILGTTVTIPTAHGDVSLKIPEGTQPGQVMRLKGKGMPVLGSMRHGDHYVTVFVDVPKRLTRAERKLVEEWRKVANA